MHTIVSPIVSLLDRDEQYRTLAQSIFGTIDPPAIARFLSDATYTALGSVPERVLLFDMSVGAAFGLRLEDGREVFLKVLIDQRFESVEAMCSYVNFLAERGVPCPRVLAPPVWFKDRIVVVYEYLRGGNALDTRAPELRAAMAEMLARIHEITATFPDPSVADCLPDGNLDLSRLWPPAHNALFDFSRNKDAAGWLENLAERILTRLRAGASLETQIVSHLDWSAKHFRFAGDGSIVAIYDWDSLHRVGELRSLGVAAATHLYTWDIPVVTRVPTIDQINAFLDVYERTTGVPLSDEQRSYALCHGLHTICYVVRCQYSIDVAQAEAGDEVPFLREVVPSLLE